MLEGIEYLGRTHGGEPCRGTTFPLNEYDFIHTRHTRSSDLVFPRSLQDGDSIVSTAPETCIISARWMFCRAKCAPHRDLHDLLT